MPLGPGPPRFLQLADVAEILNISPAQAYALVRRGNLRAIKIGGRGAWRVEATELEAYIQQLYAQTREFIDAHPFGEADGDLPDGDLRDDISDRAGDRADGRVDGRVDDRVDDRAER